MRKLLAAIAMFCWAGPAPAQQNALVADGTITLTGTSGRIDHMAMDWTRGRLIVAELGNGTVDLVDVRARKVVHRFTGLKEPQGVEYIPQGDLIVIACGGDGMVRFFGAGDFSPRGTVALGDDADDVRIDRRNGHVLVGYGSGGIAVIDPGTQKKIGDLQLPRHPEGFQAGRDGQVFVNVPDAGQLVAGTLDSGKRTATWSTGKLAGNFPMALDKTGQTLAVVYRNPARLELRDTRTGRELAALETCGDSDDVYFDDKRQRLYVSCGSGQVDVFAVVPALKQIDRVQTGWGARTSLFVSGLDRLFVAQRSGLLGSDAAIHIFAPAP